MRVLRNLTDKSAITKMQAVVVAIVIIVAAVAGGGAVYWLTLPTATNEPIKIGFMAPLSGTAAETGDCYRKAATLAVEEWNANGGINGRNISIIFEDDEYTVAKGVAVFEKLVTLDKVDAVVGTLSSGIALSVMDLAAKYSIPYLTVGAMSSEISLKILNDTSKYWMVWKELANDTIMCGGARDAITYYVDNGMYHPATKTFAMLYEDTDHGRDMKTFFNQFMTAKGWTLTGEQQVATTQVDYYPQLTALKAGNPDIIFSIQSSLANSAKMTMQFHELGIKALNLVMYLPTYATYVGLAGGKEACEGLTWTIAAALLPGMPAYDSFVAKMKARWNITPNLMHAVPYDAMNIMLSAIQRAGSTDAHKIADELAKTDYHGLLGRFVFSESHEAIYGVDYLNPTTYQIINGTSIPIYPPDIAKANFTAPPY